MSRPVRKLDYDLFFSGSQILILIIFFRRRHGNSTIQTLLASKEGLVQRGSSQRIKTLVPSLSAAWFSDIVIPAVIVSIVVVVSLFAIVVLLLLRRHMAFEGHDTGSV